MTQGDLEFLQDSAIVTGAAIQQSGLRGLGDHIQKLQRIASRAEAILRAEQQSETQAVADAPRLTEVTDEEAA